MSSDDIALGSLIVAILALCIAFLGLFLQSIDFFDRRRERERPIDLETFQESLSSPFATNWTIRVWGKKRLEHLRVMFDGVPLKVFESLTEVREDVLLVKGGGLNFRVPSNHPVSTASKVVILDGSKIIEERAWGSIPQTKP